MNKMKFSILGAAIAASITIAGCSSTNQSSSDSCTGIPLKNGCIGVIYENTKSNEDNNPLLKPFSGKYGGVPAFDKVDINDFEAAFDIAMAEALAEIEAIANQVEAPTFENTIVALEKSGKKMGRVSTYLRLWRSNNSSPELREIYQSLAPKLSAYRSKIGQNTQLFNRIQAVYNGDEYNTLNSEQQRVAWLTYNSFSRNGATLKGEKKVRFAEIGQELATLYTQFSNNVLADEENYVLYLNEDQLSGLSESFIRSAAAAAEERGFPGKFAITNTRSSMAPFLTFADDRALREQVWKSYYNRGNNGDQYDNNEIIQKILTLRHERVQLLGYENYAAWRLEDRMAKTPERAMALMENVWPSAIDRVEQEVNDMQALAERLGASITLEPWDYRYYAEKVRKEKYALDSDEVKQYLQLDKLRESMFYVAGRVFNFEFTPVKEGTVPVFHPDVRVWEVTDKNDGHHIGLWYLDPFARKGKRSGAWASMYRQYSTFDGLKTVLSSNNSNFVKGVEGEPTLISWDNAETFFHEFGHALHFLSASVAYPRSHSGVRDYTEFQSQLLERWLMTDEVLNKYLVHYKTGQPIPKSLVAKIKRAATFNSGFKTTEYMASAIMDLLYHTTDPKKIDPQTFEAEQLARLGLPKEVVMRHRSTHFGHVFSGEGYSAGYYGYMWAEVLTSDAAEAFAEAEGGFYDTAVSDKLVKYLFSVRNAMDPVEAYRAFRGRDASVDALLRDRGFPVIR